MKVTDKYLGYEDSYEYHGSTTIERIRKKGNKTISRDWLIFDTVEEAFDYYNNNCFI